MGNKRGWYLQLHFLTCWNILWFCSLIGFAKLPVCHFQAIELRLQLDQNSPAGVTHRSNDFLRCWGAIPTSRKQVSRHKGQPWIWGLVCLFVSLRTRSHMFITHNEGGKFKSNFEKQDSTCSPVCHPDNSWGNLWFFPKCYNDVRQEGDWYMSFYDMLKTFILSAIDKDILECL